MSNNNNNKNKLLFWGNHDMAKAKRCALYITMTVRNISKHTSAWAWKACFVSNVYIIHYVADTLYIMS